MLDYDGAIEEKRDRYLDGFAAFKASLPSLLDMLDAHSRDEDIARKWGTAHEERRGFFNDAATLGRTIKAARRDIPTVTAAYADLLALDVLLAELVTLTDAGEADVIISIPRRLMDASPAEIADDLDAALDALEKARREFEHVVANTPAEIGDFRVWRGLIVTLWNVHTARRRLSALLTVAGARTRAANTPAPAVATATRPQAPAAPSPEPAPSDDPFADLF
ncbi:hypothetical protein [Mycobacterium servetii]|uniref:Uncharacterized protein n=1 Tax=Mycobacterium servetii TaxID=3237418 RepID=A0ABV4BUG5_9MYCO